MDLTNPRGLCLQIPHGESCARHSSDSTRFEVCMRHARRSLLQGRRGSALRRTMFVPSGSSYPPAATLCKKDTPSPSIRAAQSKLRWQKQSTLRISPRSSRISSSMRSFLLALASCAFSMANVASAASDLPVIFFHGITATYEAGDNFVANLTAEGRTVASLSFCDGTCSMQSILTQIPMAIQAVREVVANNSVFDDGYIFIAHSQGGPIARAVIEEMDDHKVKRFISLAGLQNGQFIGPDKVDVSIANNGAFLTMLVPDTMFNYSAYGPGDYYGKMQKDYVKYTIENPDAQYSYSQFNVNRWPQFGSFSTANFFLPVYNNVNPCLPGNDQCVSDQHRRKANFLKLEEAHFFASAADDVIMPWQSCIFGRYSEVDTIEEIETQYNNLTVVAATETLEYTADTFGLQTLDKRGGLFLYEIANVSHGCWAKDEGGCVWATVYDQHIYPTLV